MSLEPSCAPRPSWMIGGARWRPCCQLSWCDFIFSTFESFNFWKHIQSMQNLADCQRTCYHFVGTSGAEWLHEESPSKVPGEAEGPLGICGDETGYSGQIPNHASLLDVRTGLHAGNNFVGVYKDIKEKGPTCHLLPHDALRNWLSEMWTRCVTWWRFAASG